MKGSVEKNYSEALFELAFDEKSLDRVHDDLELISKVFSDNEDIYKFLFTPTIEFEEKEKVITSSFKDSLCDISHDFLCLIVKKGRIKYLQNIIDRYNKLFDEEKQILEVTAITTQELSDELREKLVDKLHVVFKKQIVLHEKIDQSIIGGIILEIGDKHIRASIKDKLERLKANIDNIIA